ncbi:MAG: hypothetical protein R2788_05875 [Saprospiraceae bacterium]
MKTPTLIFYLGFEDQVASANFVLASDDFVFVAKGQGGLKILERPRKGDLLLCRIMTETVRPKLIS